MASTSVLSQRNFLLLWGGQFVSDFGGQLSTVALPCALVLVLGATPMQVGTLQAIEFGIIPLLAMIAGVYVDRFARRPMMIGANVIRLCALAALPAAYLLHHLSIGLFFAVGALVGAASVIFDTAYQAFLPVLVGPEHIVEGNAKMTMGASTAEVAGNSISGVIVTSLGAPVSIALNALAYVVATFALLRIRCDESRRERSPDARVGFRSELIAGARVVLCNPVLRTIAAANATSHLGGAMVMAVFYVYLYRDLHLAPLLIGIVLGFANIGVAGAFFAARIAERLGMRATLTGALVVSGLGNLVLPVFAHASPLLTILAMRLLLTLAGPVFDVNQQTLRLRLVAPELHGRMNATMRTLVWSALPVGALFGGWLGSVAGIIPAMLAGGGIALAAAMWMFACPALDDERATRAATAEAFAAV